MESYNWRRKEIERELLIEWDDYLMFAIKEKISFDWSWINEVLSSCFNSINLSTADNENNNIIKKIINKFLNYYHINRYNHMKEKENYCKEIEEKTLTRSFLIAEWKRMGFIDYFITPLTNSKFYSILNIFYLINKSEEWWDIIIIYEGVE